MLAYITGVRDLAVCSNILFNYNPSFRVCSSFLDTAPATALDMLQNLMFRAKEMSKKTVHDMFVRCIASGLRSRIMSVGLLTLQLSQVTWKSTKEDNSLYSAACHSGLTQDAEMSTLDLLSTYRHIFGRFWTFSGSFFVCSHMSKV